MTSLWRHSNLSLGFGFLKLFEFLQFVIKWLKITEDTFSIRSISHEDHIINFDQWFSISTFPKKWFLFVSSTHTKENMWHLRLNDCGPTWWSIRKKLTKLYQKPNWNCVFVFLQFQHSHEQLTNRIHLGRMNELIHKRRYHQPTMKNNWSHPRCKCVGEPKYAINILISILSEHMILLSLSITAWRELFKILNFIIWNQFIDRKSDWFTSSSFNMAHMDTWQSRGTSGAVSILQIVQ